LHFKNENYRPALKEYQRYLFFSDDQNANIYYNIGNCYRNLHHYDRAIEFYDKAFFSFQIDSLKYSALYKKIECYIRTNEFGLALAELLMIEDTTDRDNYYLRQFYLGVCYYGMVDFTNAEKYFINSIDQKFEPERKKIAEIFKRKKRFYRPNPSAAWKYSMIMPGLGQFYSGDFRNGANSLVLTGTLAYIGITIALNQSIGDAIISVFPWFYRYYEGGYLRAETIAIEKRSEKRSKIYKEIIGIIAETK
jgi:tetratricopeptide (TPR) repeat protein